MRAGDPLDGEGPPPGLREQERRARRMRAQLAEHPCGLDPNCPDFDEDDVEALEAEVERFRL